MVNRFCMDWNKQFMGVVNRKHKMGVVNNHSNKPNNGCDQ